MIYWGDLEDTIGLAHVRVSEKHRCLYYGQWILHRGCMDHSWNTLHLTNGSLKSPSLSDKGEKRSAKQALRAQIILALRLSCRTKPQRSCLFMATKQRKNSLPWCHLGFLRSKKSTTLSFHFLEASKQRRALYASPGLSQLGWATWTMVSVQMEIPTKDRKLSRMASETWTGSLAQGH